MAVSHALRRLSAVAASKASFAARLRDESDYLATGVWFVPTPSTARQLTSEPPPEGVPTTAPSTKARVLALLTLLTPPMLLLRLGRQANGGATSAILTKAGGLVLFDPEDCRVTHRRVTPLPETYPVLRETLERYLPGPPWSVSDDRRTLFESLVIGDVLRSRPEAERVRIARGILTRCAALVRDAVRDGGRGDSTAMIDDALARAAAADLPRALASELRELGPELRAAAADWPLVPAHGDLTGLNVIVSPDGRWTAIDFEDSGRLPYFYDAFSLLVRDRALLDEARRGAFTDELSELDASALAPASVRDTELKLAATALLAAVRHSTNHGGRLPFTLGSLWPTRPPSNGR